MNNNIVLDTRIGNSINQVAEIAKETASPTQNVEFDFNGITCIVSIETNIEYLVRDYLNAHLMDWKEVGPDCLAVYNSEVVTELNTRRALQEQKQDQQRKEWQKKDASERDAFNVKTKGVEIELSDAKEWHNWKSKNTDSYGACIFEFAEGWAKLMQVEIAKFKDSDMRNFAERTSFELGFLGITGFMYGAAVSILAKCWKHGEQLRKWHNKEYKHEGDGVVNPAVLTIKA